MYGNTGACISEASHYVGVTFPIVDKNWETEEHKTLDCVQETGEFCVSVGIFAKIDAVDLEKKKPKPESISNHTLTPKIQKKRTRHFVAPTAMRLRV